MEAARTIKSFWWAPDNPSVRWFGVLTLETSKTPTLEVFVERGETFADMCPPGSVIHGKDEHGKPITLFFAGSPGSNISGAVLKRTFRAGYALIGISLPDDKSFTANSLRFQLQHLYGWLGRSGFQRETEVGTHEFSVRYKHPADEWLSIDPDLEMGIHATFEEHNGSQERRIKEDAAITFRSKTGFSLVRCNELIAAMRLLLHFALLKKVYPVWITAYRDGHGHDFQGRWIDYDIEVASSILRDAESELPIPEYWVFRYDDVRSDFAAFIQRWLNYQEKFTEAIGCYSSTIYHSLTSQMTLLTLTQALDAYHGINFQSHKSNDFKAKIRELVGIHASSLQGLVDDIEDFSERVQVTRNYYTHHNPHWMTTGKVADRSDLIRMNEKLKLLFQMCVLTDLGIPADRFRRLRRQLATEIIHYS